WRRARYSPPRRRSPSTSPYQRARREGSVSADHTSSISVSKRSSMRTMPLPSAELRLPRMLPPPGALPAIWSGRDRHRRPPVRFPVADEPAAGELATRPPQPDVEVEVRANAAPRPGDEVDVEQHLGLVRVDDEELRRRGVLRRERDDRNLAPVPLGPRHQPLD